MKKFIIGMAAIVASALPAVAAEVAYNQKFVNQVVTTTTSFVFDMNAYGADAISFQATVSSATPQTSTFTDGTLSTGTITVVSTTSLAVAGSSATISISSNTALQALAGSVQVLVSSNGTTGQSGANILTGSTLTIVGVPLYSGTQWNVGASSAATAISIAAAINSYVPNVRAVVAPVGGATITVTCSQLGSYCNSYTVQTSTKAIAFSSAGLVNFFTNGTDNASFTLFNTVRAKPLSITFTQGQQWFEDPSYSTNTAVSIASAVNSITELFTASTNTTTSVLINTVPVGTKENNWKISVSTSAFSISTGVFRGGSDNAVLTINGVTLTQGTDWNVGTTSATAANAISAAINANSVLSAIMTTTAPLTCTIGRCGVVVATGTINTTGNNYQWSSSTQAALSLTNAGLYGGTTASYTLNGTAINIPNHSLATGEEVKFTSGTIALGGLTNQTSYYVIYVDANDVGLSNTSTGSIAGLSIPLTSTSTTGAHTFTLTPLALVGSTVLTWSASNDGVNFSTPTLTAQNISLPINALNSTWAPITYTYDLGNTNYRYWRVTESGPSTAGNGGINTVITGYGKRYWR